ncbi:tyrosine-protein kinase Drl-like isoform X2 [Condylostylus longicornis]|uniref:tyrosine-protein kinase Drl-like isoform X2 n=1 Tax=Condylostylus longicornis TaxID=2530218 RepID=UPI00244E0EAF|nr:tyrosine-protein kinase Drl-like isoform X2 [Condylostylus longicornis]
MTRILHSGFYCLWFFYLTHGYINIFMSHKEVKKLMDLEADIFYVHQGNINNYVIQFRIPLSSDHENIIFSWESLTSYPLLYQLTVHYEIEKQNALGIPQISIPAEGYVPQRIETFTIHLPCTGNVSLQVPLKIHMFVKGPPRQNDIKLNFKAKKNCLKVDHPIQRSNNNNNNNNNNNDNEENNQNHNSRETNISPKLDLNLIELSSQGPEMFGAVTCALGLVIGLLASAMYIRARKKFRQDSLNASLSATDMYENHQETLIKLDSTSNRRPSSVNSDSYATITSLNKFPLAEYKKSWLKGYSTPSPYATALLPMGNHQIAETIYSKPESVYQSDDVAYYASSNVPQYVMPTPKIYNNPIDVKEKIRKIPSIQPGMLETTKIIKEGMFGRIYAGQLGDSCKILIKTVIDGASLTQVGCLLSDASLLVGISHQNILSPMLACTELPGPPEIAYPYPENEILKIFLQKSKETNTPINTRQLVEFALKITKGLSYLHSIGIIHKDIATRNCFLDGDFNVKICDSALSRDLFPDDYHCLGDNENRPIKWMALETIQKRIHTSTSDIWSLGVLYWELITLSINQPFEEVDIFELGPYLNDGFRLGQPVNCPDEFYTVMSCCWLADPKQRPSLNQLIAFLTDFHDDLGKYI